MATIDELRRIAEIEFAYQSGTQELRKGKVWLGTVAFSTYAAGRVQSIHGICKRKSQCAIPNVTFLLGWVEVTAVIIPADPQSSDPSGSRYRWTPGFTGMKVIQESP